MIEKRRVQERIPENIKSHPLMKLENSKLKVKTGKIAVGVGEKVQLLKKVQKTAEMVEKIHCQINQGRTRASL